MTLIEAAKPTHETQIFENDRFGPVRVINRAGEPWFVAADVCRALDVSNTAMAMERLDADEKGVSSIDTPGGEQDMTVVSEPGLYGLVLGSRKPEARAFKRWITHEVIPDIRKHGFYGTDKAIEDFLVNPDRMIQVLSAYKAERAQRVALQDQAEQDAPKVLFADSVAASKQSILVGELAKLLKQNGIPVGQNRLYDYLRNNGYLIKTGCSRNMPTQYSMERGIFEIKESTFNDPSGNIHITKTPKVTGKGQVYFVNKFLRGEI